MKPQIGQKKTLACTGRDFGIVKSESNTPSEYQEPPNGEWWGPFHPDFGTSTGDEHAVGMVQPTLHPKFREPIYKTGLTSLPKFLNWYNTDPRPLNKAAKVSLLLHTTAMILLLRYYYCVLRKIPHRILSFSTNTPDPDQHGSAHRIGTDVRRQWMDLRRWQRLLSFGQKRISHGFHLHFSQLSFYNGMPNAISVPRWGSV